jgi:anti-anti-sigma factor
MPFFTVSSSLHGTAFVVQAFGELDYQHAPVFRDEMAKAWESEVSSVVVIDVTELTFCDSTGLGELILSLQRSQARGTRLALVGVHGTLERILTITGLRPAFELFPSVEDALRGT